MLNLSRRVGESLTIGNATVYIQEVRGNHVSLSIDAPRDVIVRRSELDDRPDPDKEKK